MTIPGVGAIIAAFIMSQIGAIERFPNARKLCAYAGIVPRVFSSGMTNRTGRITRAGRHLLRWALSLDDHIALEASLNSYFLYDRFNPEVAYISLANPMKLKIISKNPAKNDRNDAGKIAKLAYLGYLPAIWMPDEETRQDREIIQHRCALVKDLTRVKNRIRSHLGKHGIVCPSSDLQNRDAQLFVQAILAKLTRLAQAKLQSLLRQMDMLEKEIKHVEKIVDTRADRCPEIDFLMSISGMNTLNAFAVRAVIGDISRFPRPECLANYAGMVPKMRSSGTRSWSGPISKAGSKMLRWAITETVQILVRQPGTMRNHYLRLLRRKSKGTAITACGRKLLEIIWHMLSKKIPFRETRPDLNRRKQRQRAARPRFSPPAIAEVLPSVIEHLTVLRELTMRSSCPFAIPDELKFMRSGKPTEGRLAGLRE